MDDFNKTVERKLSVFGQVNFQVEANCRRVFLNDLWIGNVCNANDRLLLRIFPENSQFLENCNKTAPCEGSEEMFEVEIADDAFLSEAIRLTCLGAERRRRSTKIRRNFINRSRNLKKL